ncbi:MAG: FliO/MopB family protein [Limisphaerales bacterium]
MISSRSAHHGAGGRSPATPCPGGRISTVIGAITGGFLASVVAMADPLPAPSPELPLPELGVSVLRVLGAMAFVIALLLAGAWLVRNWQRVVARPGRDPKLRVIEARSVGGRHAVYVLGYETQRFLIASSPTGVSLLSALPPATEPESEPSLTPANAPAFLDTLRLVLGRK